VDLHAAPLAEPRRYSFRLARSDLQDNSQSGPKPAYTVLLIFSAGVRSIGMVTVDVVNLGDLCESTLRRSELSECRDGSLSLDWSESN